ncbi:unknown [Peptostreptococcus anaerobius CAG:621]|uniref:hypothetical protein n=1 Tax=Peptostreptococcus anaerobius TaxID=1261 RepID=UPI00033DC4D3|nr:hypothetical protein [Peptostreptococcus anaerobius]CCY47844.1 unknown [Peptostreptococcus anaerobius CAG:621]
MHIEGKFKLSEEEIQDLDYISSQSSVGAMYLSVNIYNQIKESRLLDSSNSALWRHHRALTAILCHGYRMGVQAERQKQRAKQSHNEV